LELIRRAVEAVDIPIIASLNGITRQGWIDYARLIEEGGARGIELNIYTIPTDRELTGRQIEQQCLEVLRAVQAAVGIPIAVKLSPYFSALGAWSWSSPKPAPMPSCCSIASINRTSMRRGYSCAIILS
jgi:dihydroorotate dehydrogenase (fumarate)